MELSVRIGLGTVGNVRAGALRHLLALGEGPEAARWAAEGEVRLHPLLEDVSEGSIDGAPANGSKVRVSPKSLS